MEDNPEEIKVKKIDLKKPEPSEIIPGPAGARNRYFYIVALVFIALFCLLGFIFLTSSLRNNNWQSPIDLSIVQTLRVIHAGWLTDLMWGISLPGDSFVVVPLTLLTAVVLFVWGLKPGAIYLGATMLSEALLQKVISFYLNRPRPPVAFSLINQPTSLSFPSGHAWSIFLFVTITGLVLWRTLPKKWSTRVSIITVASVIAMLVGFSRVYLGVHWPSDILGGWILAIFTAVTTGIVYLAIVKKFRFKERSLPLGPIWFQLFITLVSLGIVILLIYRDASINPLI